MMRSATIRRTRAYTLVELLAAMGVLTIMMGFLFKFVNTAQRAWSLSESNTRLYQNAQIALDLFTHDLRAAVASNLQGAEIPFWINPNYTTFDVVDGTDNYDDWDEQDAVCFVSTIEASNGDAETRMVEVRYALFTDETDTDADHQAQLYWLRRSLTSDRTTSGVDAEWDFYGVRHDADPTLDDDWIDGRDRHHIVDGVETFSVQAYPPVTGTQNVLPGAVLVTLTLVDPEATKTNLPEALRESIRNKSRRTFTKIVFLGGQ